jgi:hypothetical protein
MSKKAKEPTVTPVRPLDPARQVKFKSASELNKEKKTTKPKSSKGVTAK